MQRDNGAQLRQLELESQRSAALQSEHRSAMEARAAEMEEARGALREAERLAAEAKEDYLRHYHLWWDTRQELEQEQRRARALEKRLRRAGSGRSSLIGLSLPDLPH